MTLQTGGKIDLTGQGYSATYGTGIPGCWSGGSYGGMGHSDCGGQATYGSYNAPINLGSGGQNGAGGGAADIECERNAELERKYPGGRNEPRRGPGSGEASSSRPALFRAPGP